MLVALFIFLACTIASSHQALGKPLIFSILHGEDFEEAMLLYNRTFRDVFAAQMDPVPGQPWPTTRLIKMLNIRRRIIAGTIFEFRPYYYLKYYFYNYCTLRLIIQPWMTKNFVVEMYFRCIEEQGTREHREHFTVYYNRPKFA